MVATNYLPPGESPDPAYQVGWIVYINGVEIPCNSATISYGVWKIPEAQITLIPNVAMHRFGAEDRVTVQIFYVDYWMTPGNPSFRLMFDGEIISWGYVNVKEGRSLVFNCVDYIQIFTQLFFFFMSSLDDLVTGASGNSIGVFQNGILKAGFAGIFPYSLFSQGLVDPGTPVITTEEAAATAAIIASRNVARPERAAAVERAETAIQEVETTDGRVITRPIDFVYNIIRALIKVQLPNKTIPAANFFAPWAKRTQFHRRFLALPGLEEPGVDENGVPLAGIFPILRAIQNDAAISAMAKLVAESPGSAGSIWDMVTGLLKITMTELVMLPTAPIVVSDYVTLQVHGAPGVLPTTLLTPSFLGNYFVKPQFLFGIPPTCNVFFPSQIVHYAYDETFITQPTRMYMNDKAMLDYLNADNPPGSIGTLVTDALVTGFPEEVDQAIRNRITAHEGNDKNFLVYPNEYFLGPNIMRRVMPRWFYMLQNAQSTAPGATEEATLTDPARDVYKLYAEYEFYKEKYSQRTGAVHLAFNPYPVPGFPCAIFDRRSAPLDTLGYVMNVTQTMTSKGWGTSVAYSYGRTFSEMFQLLQDQFAMEHAAVRAELHETNTGWLTQPAGEETPLPAPSTPISTVGAIAVAPPEPIIEIRDIIQNFDRAESFYKSLFQRDTAEAVLLATTAELVMPSSTPSIMEVEPSIMQGGTTADATGAITVPKKASFYYPDIIQLETTEGVQDISLEGYSASARRQLLASLTKMKTGAATPAELNEVRSALRQPGLQQVPAGTTDETLQANLDRLITQTTQSTPSSNLTGDAGVHIKESARSLFESYDAAMQYCARPICTLEEYIDFLGEGVGVRLNKVTQQDALVMGDPRTFATDYYMIIREYIAGPPPTVTNANTSNPIPTTGAPTTNEDGTVATVAGVPADFPENRRNWTEMLLRYREDILYKLSPGT